MQGLVNIATAVGDAIAVLLPAACYLAALGCFLFFAWTLWGMAGGPASGRWAAPPPYLHRPWVPFVSLVLSGVFASFPGFLTMASVSMGTSMAASLTSYAPTTPPTAAGIVGATPYETMLNVVRAFERFFQAFGAGCAFFAVLRWRAIVNGRAEASPLGCGVQLLSGVALINVVTVAAGLLAYFA